LGPVGAGKQEPEHIASRNRRRVVPIPLNKKTRHRCLVDKLSKIAAATERFRLPLHSHTVDVPRPNYRRSRCYPSANPRVEMRGGGALARLAQIRSGELSTKELNAS
jgi:hypothetical protein